jgi:hypothetical protein
VSRPVYPPSGPLPLRSGSPIATASQNEGKLVLKRAEDTKTAMAMHGLSRCAAAAAAGRRPRCGVRWLWARLASRHRRDMQQEEQGQGWVAEPAVSAPACFGWRSKCTTA